MKDTPSLSHQLDTRDLEPTPRPTTTTERQGRKVKEKHPIGKMHRINTSNLHVPDIMHMTVKHIQ